jgi:hypothetical protein
MSKDGIVSRCGLIGIHKMIVPTLGFLLESHHVWVVFTVAVLILCCMFELWYQHPHPFCIICILDSLLNQKLSLFCS